MKKLFLCLVIDRTTGKELMDYEVESIDWCFARHTAADLFRKDQKYQPRLRKCGDWYVDSCEI